MFINIFLVCAERISVLLDGFTDERQTLFVCLGDGGPFVWPQFVRAKARNPHVPVSLQVQLHILYLDFGHLAMLGEQTCRIDGIFDKVVGNLQQQFFDLFVQLFGGIDFADQFLQAWLAYHRLNGIQRKRQYERMFERK